MATLVYQANQLNKLLEETTFIQKVQSTPISVVLRLRLPGKSVFLHFGRGKGTEGIWIGEDPPIVEVRVRDKFQEWVKKYIVGQKLVSVSIDNKYRIITFSLVSKFGESKFGLFYKGRKLYFAHGLNKLDSTVFKSWKLGSEETLVDGLFSDIYDGPEDKKGEVSNFNIVETYQGLISIKENVKKKKLLNKKIFTEKNKLLNIEKAIQLQPQLYSLNSVEIIQKFGEFGLSIKRRQSETDHQFLDRSFTKIKSFKNSKIFSEVKIQRLENELKDSKTSVYLQKTKYPVWDKEIKNKKNGNVIYFTMGKLKGALGRNVRGNDFLRNKFSTNKKDSWFHLEGEKSAHVVIKVEIDKLSKNEVELIGSLIRDQMNLNVERVKLIGSSIQNIRGIKGRAGSVTINNPNYFDVLYNSGWKEIISTD